MQVTTEVNYFNKWNFNID